MSIDKRVRELHKYFDSVRIKYPNLFETRNRLENGLVKVSEIYQKKLDSLFSYLVDFPRKTEVRKLMNTAIDRGYDPAKLVSHYREYHHFLGRFSRRSRLHSKSL